MFATNSTERLRITSAGKVGINQSTPTAMLEVVDSAYHQLYVKGSSTVGGIRFGNSGNENGFIYYDNGPNMIFNVNNSEKLRIESGGGLKFTGQGTSIPVGGILHHTNNNLYVRGGTSGLILGNQDNTTTVQIFNGYIKFETNDGTEKLRITSTGKVLIGSSTHNTTIASGVGSQLQIEGNSYTTSSFTLINNQNSTDPAFINFGKSRAGSAGGTTIVQNGDRLGGIRWAGADGTDLHSRAASLDVYVDGAPGSNDMPGAMVFSTTPDGTHAPVERLRITSGGYSKHSNDGTYDTYANAVDAHQFRQSANKPTLWCSNSNSSHTWDIIRAESARSGNSAFQFIVCTSGNLTDDEFRVRGDGQIYADGSFNAGGADYAEYFEWTDGNSSNEDRRGMTVVLDENKVKLSTSSDSADNIIGVVSGNASVIGDSSWNKWSGKYQKDDYGAYLRDENGERKLNPSFDDTKTYVSREDRQEWDAIGMVGKLRIRKGQKTGTRWIKMRDISDTVEEWLVR